MKKIDLHIHTVATVSDRDFVFSIDTLKGYVQQCELDAIAVTNHNVFDVTQFRHIQDEIPTVVFPGIEINVGNGHLLLISDDNDIADFDSRCHRISSVIIQATNSVSVAELGSIFGDLSGYILIPHYEKGPPIRGQDLMDLLPYVCAGEVDSAKKFVRAIRDPSKLCPVLFSDSRMRTGLDVFSTRQPSKRPSWCGVATTVVMSSSASLRHSTSDSATVAGPSSRPGKQWQWISVNFSHLYFFRWSFSASIMLPFTESIISHAEKITPLAIQPRVLLRWLEHSAHLQITASSLVGDFGQEVQRAA